MLFVSLIKNFNKPYLLGLFLTSLLSLLRIGYFPYKEYEKRHVFSFQKPTKKRKEGLLKKDQEDFKEQQLKYSILKQPSLLKSLQDKADSNLRFEKSSMRSLAC